MSVYDEPRALEEREDQMEREDREAAERRYFAAECLEIQSCDDPFLAETEAA